MRAPLGLAALFVVAAAAGQAAAQTGSAYGRVVDENKRPVAGAKVALDFQGGIARHYEAKTDKKGEFRLLLTFGRYEVTASKEGYRGAQTGVTIVTGDAAPITDLVMVSLASAQQDATAQHAILGPFQKATDLAEAGRLDEAQAIFEDLIGKDDSIPEVHYNLALVHLKKKQPRPAERELRKALELAPAHRGAFIALAQLHEEEQQLGKAIDVMAQAAAAYPSDAKIQLDLGILYWNAKRAEEARTALERVEGLDPAHLDAQYLLGTLALGRGDTAEAVRRLETYVAAAPEGASNLETAKKLLSELKKAPPKP